MKEQILDEARTIRQLWIPLLGADDRLREPIAKTLASLEVIEALAQDRVGRTMLGVAEPLESIYAVIRSDTEEVLAEFHGDTKYPYRVPGRIYTAIAQVLETGKPLLFEDIRRAVAKTTNQDIVPDYLIRVPIRLWMHKAAVLRESRKYTPISGTRFTIRAKEIWASLPRKLA